MRRTGAAHVWLDMSALNPEYVRNRFPRIYQTCMLYGVDIAKSSPVHPAAHYAMGGVRTDLDGRTSVPGLYAAGEAACNGVHGANRLASNSLLEGVVYGRRAGAAMAADSMQASPNGEPPPFTVPSLVSLEIRTIAWQNCGISRDHDGLEAAISRLNAAKWASASPTLAAVETRNMHTVATLIEKMALWREESRGGHYRTDFPNKRPEFAIPSQTKCDS